MTDAYRITETSLEALFATLRQDGRRILAPVTTDGRTELQEVQTPAQVSKDHLQTVLSAKGTVFPRVERILAYTVTPREVKLHDLETNARPTVLFGVRPCDADAFGALDAVFNWDYRDAFFNDRMERLAVISISCLMTDDACFCKDVGGGPGNTKGSDILLTPLAEGYLAEVITERGRTIQALAPEAFQPCEDVDKDSVLAQVGSTFNREHLRSKLPGIFDHDIWRDQSLACLGCGACTFVCPTCVCFDIQEETDSNEGHRLRCWDSCGFHMFTRHASGHNPREFQSQRWRQRLQHKFSYYPEHYGIPGCVGCGRCTRACPVDMNLRECLAEVSEA